MKAIALVSFAGVVNGFPGQEVEIADQTVYDDLLQAGYIKAAGAETEEPKKPAPKKKAKEK